MTDNTQTTHITHDITYRPLTLYMTDNTQTTHITHDITYRPLTLHMTDNTQTTHITHDRYTQTTNKSYTPYCIVKLPMPLMFT